MPEPGGRVAPLRAIPPPNARTGWAVAPLRALPSPNTRAGRRAGASAGVQSVVYPTLLAVSGDVAHPGRRGRAVGVHRLWRDGGLAIGVHRSGRRV